MADYRRANVPGGTFFFTVVTHDRRPILTTDLARSCLRQAFREVRGRRPFAVEAIVLLPEHLHTIWTLPSGDTDYPLRWRQIKTLFTKRWLACGGGEGGVSIGRARQADRGVWQRRYYEHTIEHEDDLARCLDYIHINPVKHGYCDRAIDWPWSSLHRYMREQKYAVDWGNSNEFHGDEWLRWE